jgi:hypothetical protein
VRRRLARGLRGGWGRAVFSGAAAFNGNVSAWNVGNVQDMRYSASGPASIPSPRCPRLRSPAGGSHAPPAALGRCLGGGRGESIACLRELWVVVVGSSRAHAAADTRAEGGMGGAQCSTAPRPSTGTCRRGMSAASRTWQAVRAAPPPPRPPLPSCVPPAGGRHSPPAALEPCLWGGVGASGLGRRALSHRGARTPDHKIWPQRCHGRVDVPPLTACVGRWVADRSVLRRHGLQRGPVGVECQQRLGHGPECVRPRLRHVPRLPSFAQPSRGQSRSARSCRALPEDGEAWGRPASARVRCPTVGLEPPTTRSFGSAATGVRLCRPSGRSWGVGCVRAVFWDATAFNGDLSAWNVGNVESMTGSASGPASIPCPAALVCAAQPGAVTLRPPPSGAASAGGAGSPFRAYVNCGLWS